MKNIKTFESWNDNIIDNSLFSSGKAKYHPKVEGGKIKYKTGTTEPYYFADIENKGGKFICKIYKKKKDGEDVRIRNKMKKTLKLAHNYVREFLNQKLNKKKKRKREDSDVIREDPQLQLPDYNPMSSQPMELPKKRAIIRRFS